MLGIGRHEMLAFHDSRSSSTLSPVAAGIGVTVIGKLERLKKARVS
jgi:hypothetical protein